MSSFKKWRSAGIITIIGLGFLLHDIYSWTGTSKIAALFVPVNESVWEHLKLGYWAVVLFSIPEYLQLKERANNYFFAKLIGVLALETAILIIFYAYTLVTGHNIVVVDIFSYVIGVFACQYFTYALFRLKPISKFFNKISLAAFIAIGILFGVITYYPPHAEIFMDKSTHTFGIREDKLHARNNQEFATSTTTYCAAFHHRAQLQTIIRKQGLTPDFVEYIGTKYRRLT